MANSEHLEILKQGVEIWNAWREKNPDVRADLSGADLRRSDFIDANLGEVDLREVRLFGADLREANLRRADLRGAHLSGSDLSGSHLSDADLSGADLVGADLEGADLERADLRRADLRESNLKGSDLEGADLRQADLRRADLREVHLSEANLHQAHLEAAELDGSELREADLSEAYLSGTDFSWTDLREANLSGARLVDTHFGNANLTGAKGLEACRFLGPSNIDPRTLAKSGPLPLAFLRGCGLPDALIDAIPALLDASTHSRSCFIRYSSDNDNFAEKLYDDLQSEGVRCWLVPEDENDGDAFLVPSDRAVRLQDRLLLIFSEQSMNSLWMQEQVEAAFEREEDEDRRILLVIRLDGAAMDSEVGWVADIRRQRDIADFSQWNDRDAYKAAFERLLNDLKAPST